MDYESNIGSPLSNSTLTRYLEDLLPLDLRSRLFDRCGHSFTVDEAVDALQHIARCNASAVAAAPSARPGFQGRVVSQPGLPSGYSSSSSLATSSHYSATPYNTAGVSYAPSPPAPPVSLPSIPPQPPGYSPTVAPPYMPYPSPAVPSVPGYPLGYSVPPSIPGYHYPPHPAPLPGTPYSSAPSYSAAPSYPVPKSVPQPAPAAPQSVPPASTAPQAPSNSLITRTHPVPSVPTAAPSAVEGRNSSPTVSTPNPSGGRNQAKLPCRFCQVIHFESACTAYPDYSSRIARLQALGRCISCMNPLHPDKACSLPKPCGTCQGPHKFPVCPRAPPKSQNNHVQVHSTFVHTPFQPSTGYPAATPIPSPYVPLPHMVHPTAIDSSLAQTEASTRSYLNATALNPPQVGPTN